MCQKEIHGDQVRYGMNQKGKSKDKSIALARGTNINPEFGHAWPYAIESLGSFKIKELNPSKMFLELSSQPETIIPDGKFGRVQPFCPGFQAIATRSLRGG